MKKKIIIPVVAILTVIICTGTVLYANTNQKNVNFAKLLNKQEVNSIQEAYVEDKVDTNKLSSNKLIEKSNNILSKLGIESEKININNSKISQYKNEVDSRNETLISNEEFSIKLNSDNGEFLSFTSNKTSFEVNRLSNEEVKKMAQDIFNKLGISNIEQYEMSYITEFDEEIWRAGFVKKYGDLINPEENVKFSFAPQTNEIVTLAINNINYDNNETLISKDNAEKIANEYLLKSKADKMTMAVEIVRPNYLYEKKLDSGKVYKKINRARKAYVFTFNNDAKSKIYIDCTTGEVIGGDILMGGEF